MPDSGQLRQLHMREVGWTDTEAFEQGVIQRLEPELMAEKLIFPPQQTVVMAGASSESIPACPKSIASTCDSLALCFWIYRRGRLFANHSKASLFTPKPKLRLIGYRTPRSNPLDTDPTDGIYPLSFVPAAHRARHPSMRPDVRSPHLESARGRGRAPLLPITNRYFFRTGSGTDNIN